MTPKEKSDALISWWIDTIYADNPTAEWKQNLRQEAALLPLTELFAVAKAADAYLKHGDGEYFSNYGNMWWNYHE